MRTWPGLGLLLLTTLLIQVSLAEDLYWEGEDNASNEFLEVKDDSSLPGHLTRFKRQWWNIFDTSSTTAAPVTDPAPENEVVTEDPDDGGFDTKDDDDHIEGSGLGSGSNWGRPEVVPEKTLRVTFVVVQPYQEEYSNRDSVEFQQFSKTLAQAVDDLFVKLPGTQKSSLIRIQSRLADNFSCKVTLDIVTTGYDNTDRITATLRDHIKDYRYLGGVSVKDDDFSANAVNPGSSFVTCNANEIQCDDGSYCISLAARCNGNPDCADGSDERGCPIDADKFVVDQQSTGFDSNPPLKPACANPIPCSSSAVTICPEQRCNGIPDCPLEDDESPELCNNKPGPERGDQTLYVTTPESADFPDTTPYPKSENPCYPGEFRCDETRCISKSSVCNKYNDCSDGTDELDCPVRGPQKRCEGIKDSCDGDNAKNKETDAIEAKLRKPYIYSRFLDATADVELLAQYSNTGHDVTSYKCEKWSESENSDKLFLLSLVHDFTAIKDDYKLEMKTEIIKLIHKYKILRNRLVPRRVPNPYIK